MNPETPALTLEGSVARITLRRPQQANRLSPEDVEQVAALITDVNRRPEVLVLQLCATGPHFCSGYDIGSLGGGRKVDFAGMVDAMEMARPVTIAVLQGGVYGGATDLALACDFRVGTRDIEMFMPAARLGLHYYPSGLQRYVQRLGLDTAKRLFLTAQKIGAEDMRSIGYLTHLVAPEQLQDEVRALTEACTAMAPIPLLGMKKHLNRIAQGRLDLDEVQADMRRAYASDDLREGQAAWAARRPARFQGR